MKSSARAAVGVLVLLAAGASCRGASEVRAPAIGAPAPAFEAVQVDGTPVTLASLKGQVVVLNVWATWCNPCREEIPQLEALHQAFAGKGVNVVGVSVDGAGMGGDVKDFATEHQMTYQIWLDPDHNFSLKFLTVGVPETFVVDRSGTIRYRMIGALRAGDTSLVAAVRTALGAS